jgi:hypothetical protein
VDFFLQGLAGADLASPMQVLDLFQQYASSEAFADYVNVAASRMVTGLAVEGAKTWREAARKSMKGRLIYESLRKEMQGPIGQLVYQLVDENSKLISTFPEKISNQIAHFIQREQQKGRRAKDITQNLLQEFPDITAGRLRLIARTESSKASSALIQARAEEVDLDWYVWHDSEDARVRYAHRKMSGVLIPWGQPPNPEKLFPQKGARAYGAYHAGCTFNCRCWSEVIVEPSQINWPHKVFWDGSIRQMSLYQWKLLARYKAA